jgi:hypothetical protein
MVEFHLERVAPVLDLQMLRMPGDGITNRDMPQGGAGNGAGAPQGQRRASEHRGEIVCRHDAASPKSQPIVMAQPAVDRSR